MVLLVIVRKETIDGLVLRLVKAVHGDKVRNNQFAHANSPLHTGAVAADALGKRK
jgi:hypothetical protein